MMNNKTIIFFLGKYHLFYQDIYRHGNKILYSIRFWLYCLIIFSFCILGSGLLACLFLLLGGRGELS